MREPTPLSEPAESAPRSARDRATGGRALGRRGTLVLFLLILLAHGWFHQGGGWNQNIRFDQVRSIVEGGDFAVDAYAFFEPVREGRRPVDVRQLQRDDRRIPPNSLDIATYEGRGFPNKPPGVTLLGLPAYALAHGVQALMGWRPDALAAVTWNLYLVTTFSVGVLAALLAVLFLHVSRRLFPEARPVDHLLATLAVSLGTLMLPYGTLFFDHVPVTVTLFASFAFLLFAAGGAGGRRALLLPALAGACFGLAVLGNYAAALLLPLFAAYAWRRVGPRKLVAFLVGGLPAALFLVFYHQRSFGTPWATSYTFQNQEFVSSGEGRLLGVFGLPQPGVAWDLLFSDWLGLFPTSPVLLLAAVAFPLAIARARRTASGTRTGGTRPELLLAAAILAIWLAMTSSFNHPHGGAAYGPRYLVPIVPFLALPLALAFRRFPWPSRVLALVSTGLLLWVTSMNPTVSWSATELLARSVTPTRWGRLEKPVDDPRRARHDFEWRVSGNVVGTYEGRAYQVFGPDSKEARGNSFNLGEMLFPESPASLVPLLLLLFGGTAWLLRRARAEEREGEAPDEGGT